MNNPISRISAAWPISVERDAAGLVGVLTCDGQCAPLESVKDECRRHAHELRRQAIDDALAGMFDRLRKLAIGSLRLAAVSRSAAPDESRIELGNGA